MKRSQAASLLVFLSSVLVFGVAYIALAGIVYITKTAVVVNGALDQYGKKTGITFDVEDYKVIFTTRHQAEIERVLTPQPSATYNVEAENYVAWEPDQLYNASDEASTVILWDANEVGTKTAWSGNGKTLVAVMDVSAIYMEIGSNTRFITDQWTSVWNPMETYLVHGNFTVDPPSSWT